jgi:hypothetical protein
LTTAKTSRRNTEGDRLGSGLAVLETFSQDSKGKDLRFRHGVVRRVAIRKNAGQLLGGISLQEPMLRFLEKFIPNDDLAAPAIG